MGVLFSSPFSGTFSQFDGKLKEVVIMTMEVFVPFSWGLSFNSKMAFVKAILHGWFSSPLLGTFFQSPHYHLIIFGYDLFS